MAKFFQIYLTLPLVLRMLVSSHVQLHYAFLISYYHTIRWLPMKKPWWRMGYLYLQKSKLTRFMLLGCNDSLVLLSLFCKVLHLLYYR